MKLVIIVTVSVMLCCNGQTEDDEPLRAIHLLEAILNETKAAREVQENLLETINYKLEGIINNIEATNEKLTSQQSIMEDTNKKLTSQQSIMEDTNKKLTSQQNIMEDIEDMQETLVSEVTVLVNNTNTQLATLITEIQDIEFNQTVIASSNINDSSTINNKLGDIYNELSGVRQEAEGYHRLSQQWYTRPNVFVSFASCEDIKTMSPSAPSGYYNITKHDGTTQRVYCYIERSHLYRDGVEESPCGSTGWTRVAYLNMSDPLQQCPTEFRLYNENGVRACGRQTYSSRSCDSKIFYTNGTSYTEVCGRVIGHQYGYTYASTYGNIHSAYVTGVSITRGSPRQHIWTFMSGTAEDNRDCPCSVGSSTGILSFIENDYFCESGAPSTPSSPYQLYTDDPLWDGEGCGSYEGPCCNAPGIPWFHNVNPPTTDYIELRVCGRGSTSYSDAPISFYEIYIK